MSAFPNLSVKDTALHNNGHIDDLVCLEFNKKSTERSRESMCENRGTSSLLRVLALIVYYTVTTGARTYRGREMVAVWMCTKDYLIKTEKDEELKGEFTKKESSVIVCSCSWCLLHTKRRNIKIKKVQKYH